MKPVVWLIGGTSESRNLIKFMTELDIILYVSVATDYGASLIEAQTNLHVMVERMDLSAMRNFITVNKPDCVIDATHPYATIVTSTVQKACEETGCEYLRLVRPAAEEHENCIIVQDFNEAVELLSHTEGNIFLTTGSKTLQEFTSVPDYKERIALRVLPMLDSLSKALELGYKPANIICMQGPFSELLNIEMMRKYNSRYLVTKDSGSIGGFEEKAQAAAKAGAKLIVIARNGEEFGTGYSEIVKLLKDRYDSGK